MSDHDPFDGIYDDAPSSDAPSNDAPAAGEPRHSEVTVVAPDDVDVSVVSDDSSDQPRHLSKTEITRMDKAELQAAARERDLDASGSRTELQERLREYQGD